VIGDRCPIASTWQITMLTNPHEVVIARREEGTSHERIWGIMAATFSRGAAKLQPTVSRRRRSRANTVNLKDGLAKC